MQNRLAIHMAFFPRMLNAHLQLHRYHALLYFKIRRATRVLPATNPNDVPHKQQTSKQQGHNNIAKSMSFPAVVGEPVRTNSFRNTKHAAWEIRLRSFTQSNMIYNKPAGE